MGCYWSLWPAIDSDRTVLLLGLDKASLSLVFGFITGHYKIIYQVKNLGHIPGELMQGLLPREGGGYVETIEHLLCNCPALKVDSLSSANVKALYRFVNRLSWLLSTIVCIVGRINFLPLSFTFLRAAI